MQPFHKIFSLRFFTWLCLLVSFLSIFLVTSLEYKEFPFQLILLIKTILIGVCLWLATALFLKLVIQNIRLSKSLKNFFLITCTIFINFLFLEGIFAFYAQTHRYAHSLAAERWSDYYWHPKNQFGFRDREFSVDELKHEKRIFALGDSFTAGYGIEDIQKRFSNILDKKLSVDNICVLNMGVAGANTQSELAMYYQFPIKPHLLIYQYYGNDIENVAFENGRSFSGNEPYQDVHPILKLVIKNSHFLDFIYWRLPHDNGEGFVKFLADAFQSPEILSTHLGDIQKILLLSKERSVPVFVVLFPFLTSPRDSAFYTHLLKNFLTAHGAAVINVEDLIQDIPVSQRVVNKLDLHPSALVHQRVAEAIYNKLVEGGYVPSQP